MDMNEYPETPQGWMAEMIDGMNNAIAFLVWAVLGERVCLDPNRGYVDDEGKSDLGKYNDKIASHLQSVLDVVVALMRSNGYDPMDATHQLFTLGLKNDAEREKGIPVTELGGINLRVHDEILEGRDSEKYEVKREGMRWIDTVTEECRARGVPLHEGPHGVAIPTDGLPPEVVKILEMAGAMVGDCETDVVGEMNEGETFDEALERTFNEKLSERDAAEFDGVDIDGDDNDDDPFAGVDA